MAKYYYNGVLLPEIPEDVLAQYPYCWIRKDAANAKYNLVVASTPWYYNGTNLTRGNTSVSIPYFSIPISNYENAETWGSAATSSNEFGLAANRTVLWANHDIRNGSATSTTIYFYATEPVKETEAKSKELNYDVHTNFYPSGSAINYAVSDLTINYVVPVAKYSTYTVTMTEVGNRLRVCYSSVDPATITANTSVTSITEPSSFRLVTLSPTLHRLMAGWWSMFPMRESDPTSASLQMVPVVMALRRTTGNIW